MNKFDLVNKLEVLTSRLEEMENREEIYSLIFDLNENFINTISSGAGPMHSPSQNPNTTGQKIACPNCHRIMNVT